VRRIASVVVAICALSLVPADASAVATGEHRFSVLCGFSHLRQVDPIVTPGPAGTLASHLHAFFGNRSTDADSTRASLVRAGTTCELSKDRAGYWVPTLVRPDGTVVLPTGAFVYYRAPEAIADEAIRPFPRDFRLISDRYVYHCGSMRRQSSGAVDCRGVPHSKVVLSILFPPCWDGVNVDTPDHRSHAVWPRGLECPASHPVEVPVIGLHVHFPLDHITPEWRLTSGPLDTAHGDFLNSWKQRALKRLVRQCLGATKSAGDRVCERVQD
jgi:hypothetical protein